MRIKVPTGDILVIAGQLGKPLECLSLGDYGAAQNVKADFLGLTDEINSVPNGEIMPLEEKWVITVSSQYGCSMNCKFCDVPKVGPGVNATRLDLTAQVLEAINLHPEVKETKRLNLHYARMGEPTFNNAVLRHAADVRDEVYHLLRDSLVHPVVSTMLPRRNKGLGLFLHNWMELKNYSYNGDAGLQFSINSTCDEQRHEMFSGNALPLDQVAILARQLPKPKGRKIALNFALADGYKVNAKRLAKLFNPDHYMVKITPIHRTAACAECDIDTTDGYEYFAPYKEVEQQLIAEGFDVLVFVPSIDEDKGLITCGNAILSGKMPEVPYKIIK